MKVAAAVFLRNREEYLMKEDDHFVLSLFKLILCINPIVDERNLTRRGMVKRNCFREIVPTSGRL